MCIYVIDQSWRMNHQQVCPVATTPLFNYPRFHMIPSKALFKKFKATHPVSWTTETSWKVRHDGHIQLKPKPPAQGLSSSSPLLFVKKRATRMEHRIDLKVSRFDKSPILAPLPSVPSHQPPACQVGLCGIHGASWNHIWNPHQFTWLVQRLLL